MFESLRRKALVDRIDQLEERCAALLKERDSLEDNNHTLKTENKKLAQKKAMEEEQIAHKLKMREELVELDKNKQVAKAQQDAEREKTKAIAKVKDEYRDKLEGHLEKRNDELKEMYAEILTRLPDVSLAIKQKG